MTLVREQNVLLMILPACDLTRSLFAWRSARRSEAIVDGLLLAAGFVLLLLPQLAVWKVLFGHFRPGEQRTSFFHPWPEHLGSLLFSSNHGLLSWHPVWIVGLAGLALLSIRKPALGAPLILAFLAQALFLGSVSNWAGGMAFGQRRMLDCLFVIALGGATLVEAIPRRIAVVGAAALVWWNLSLLIQFGSGMIPREGPIDWREAAHNQLVAVPRSAVSIGRRYLSSKDPFFKKDENLPEMRR